MKNTVMSVHSICNWSTTCNVLHIHVRTITQMATTTKLKILNENNLFLWTAGDVEKKESMLRKKIALFFFLHVYVYILWHVTRRENFIQSN